MTNQTTLPSRKKLGYYLEIDFTNVIESLLVGDCIFTTVLYRTTGYRFNSNDIDGNGQDDYIYGQNGLIKINFNGEELTPRDENNYLISDSPGDYYIVDNGGTWEAVLNGYYSSATSRVYQFTTPASWKFIRNERNFQCYGDWDNDDIEDFMYIDGEVVLGGIPEPFISQFLLISIAIFCRRTFRFKEKKLSMVTE